MTLIIILLTIKANSKVNRTLILDWVEGGEGEPASLHGNPHPPEETKREESPSIENRGGTAGRQAAVPAAMWHA